MTDQGHRLHRTTMSEEQIEAADKAQRWLEGAPVEDSELPVHLRSTTFHHEDLEHEDTGEIRADGATRHVSRSSEPDEVHGFLYGEPQEQPKSYPTLSKLAERDEERAKRDFTFRGGER